MAGPPSRPRAIRRLVGWVQSADAAEFHASPRAVSRVLSPRPLRRDVTHPHDPWQRALRVPEVAKPRCLSLTSRSRPLSLSISPCRTPAPSAWARLSSGRPRRAPRRARPRPRPSAITLPIGSPSVPSASRGRWRGNRPCKSNLAMSLPGCGDRLGRLAPLGTTSPRRRSPCVSRW